jgi:aspartyl aminopeptidase
VILLDKNEKVIERLVHFKNHSLIIPQLAIHLDRGVNENGLLLNKQEQLSALAAIDFSKEFPSLIDSLLKEQGDYKLLLGSDLFLVPLEKAELLGFKNELIAAYRLDNLESVYAALTGVLQSADDAPGLLKMAVFWDNEEIGSETAQGAGSPFFPQTLERITLSLNMDRESYFRLLSQSLCISIDMAHALHPNHNDKHDPRHAPLLGNGIVLKCNAQQRYASDARSIRPIVEICHAHQLPLQKFVTRSDIPCGTTIGPIHASLTGIPTVDIGCPQLSMHSIREIAAIEDHLTMIKFVTAFFS